MSNTSAFGRRARTYILQQIERGEGRSEAAAQVRLCRELGIFHPSLAEDLIHLAVQDKTKRRAKARQLLYDQVVGG